LCYWDALRAVRAAITNRPALAEFLAEKLRAAQLRLNARSLSPRTGAPRIEDAYAVAQRAAEEVPPALRLAPGTKTTLRDELGRVFNHYNKVTGGALVYAAADLLGSTSISKAGDGFPAGFYHRRTNPLSRQLATGGICEDAMTAMLAGIAAYGHHTGAGSSYAAFSAPLGHIAARLHAIGNHARISLEGGENRPFFIVCAHAGLKTGEDGPTHADPQALQLLQDNFPPGAMVTLTPWDPQEVWHLVSAALVQRPAVIAPFVTRPPETVADRAALGLAPAVAAAQGVYRLRAGSGRHGTVVLQGTGVANAFVFQTLPKLLAAGLEPNVYVVVSTELFDALPDAERTRIFPEAHQQEAMGITDFTLATMMRWVRSERGRIHTLHPFRRGHFLGSGSGAMVMSEAGLDGGNQSEAVKAYVANL
jgi:transketolase